MRNRHICFFPRPLASSGEGRGKKEGGEGRLSWACLPQSDSSRRRGGITGVFPLYRDLSKARSPKSETNEDEIAAAISLCTASQMHADHTVIDLMLWLM